MITLEQYPFETDANGNILDDDGGIAYCENCCTPAQHRVVVSVEAAHDETRDFCCGCHEAYMIGVQHGRWHEAAKRGSKPGSDSSQQPPS